MKLSKFLVAAVVSASLIAPTFAADVAPLPAGKPAGTHEATLLALGPIFWIGLAAIALGVGVASSNGNSKSITTATSTGTSA